MQHLGSDVHGQRDDADGYTDHVDHVVAVALHEAGSTSTDAALFVGLDGAAERCSNWVGQL